MPKLPIRPPRTPTPEERELAQIQAQILADGRTGRARQAREHAIQREQDAAKRARSEEWAEAWQRQRERERAQREAEMAIKRVVVP